LSCADRKTKSIFRCDIICTYLISNYIPTYNIILRQLFKKNLLTPQEIIENALLHVQIYQLFQTSIQFFINLNRKKLVEGENSKSLKLFIFKLQ